MLAVAAAAEAGPAGLQAALSQYAAVGSLFRWPGCLLTPALSCRSCLLPQKSGAAAGEQSDEEQEAAPAPKKRRVSGEEELQMDEQQVLGRATVCRRQGQRVHASLGVHIAPCGRA